MSSDDTWALCPKCGAKRDEIVRKTGASLKQHIQMCEGRVEEEADGDEDFAADRITKMARGMKGLELHRFVADKTDLRPDTKADSKWTDEETVCFLILLRIAYGSNFFDGKDSQYVVVRTNVFFFTCLSFLCLLVCLVFQRRVQACEHLGYSMKKYNDKFAFRPGDRLKAKRDNLKQTFMVSARLWFPECVALLLAHILH